MMFYFDGQKNSSDLQLQSGIVRGIVHESVLARVLQFWQSSLPCLSVDRTDSYTTCSLLIVFVAIE